MKMYHATSPTNARDILTNGLEVDATGEAGYTQVFAQWADQFYGMRPTFLSVKKGKFAGIPLLVDVTGLPLVADLAAIADLGDEPPSLEAGEFIWWDGMGPPELSSISSDGAVGVESLLIPGSKEAELAIKVTGTAAVLEDIPPDRIKIATYNETSLREYIREVLNEEVVPRQYVRTMFEAGELGRQVFADRAPDGRHHGTERDTELEEEIWSALWRHLQGVSSKVPKNLLDAMVSFSKDPAYNDVFILHTSGDAYRGLEVSQEYLDEHAPSWREATWPPSKLHWQWSDVIPVDFEYQNRNESRTVSSWTPSRDVAKQFGRAGYGMVGVVLIADSTTNMFLDLKELYRFNRLDDFVWEEEIVGFGSIRVKGIKILKKLRGFE
jgi:hypothetical protein